MAYKYETQYNSPNYTPASRAQATWGRARTIEAISIHWWGDPNTGPTYEGVIATLCNPSRGASAHYVATGTGRRVACLVAPGDASWATNSANPWTISIECDPRCRDEDYDVVAELISQIRSAYGDLPLVPHKQFVATACPGNYDLGRLDALARTKDGSGDWGDVKSKEDGSLITKNDANQMRVINSEVKGWNRDETHSGKFDQGELNFWVGQPWVKHIQQAWEEGEGYRATKDKWLSAYNQLPVVQASLTGVTQERDKLKLTIEEKDAELLRLKAELDSKGTESPSNGSDGSNGNNTPSDGSGGSQTLWEWLGELLSKFKRSK